MESQLPMCRMFPKSSTRSETISIESGARCSRLLQNFTRSNFGNANAGGILRTAGGGGGGGGITQVTKFASRPLLAVALKTDLPKNAQAMLVDKLTGVDENGKTHESLPTSNTVFMVCPKYESKHPGSVIAYFPKPILKSQKFTKLSGTMQIAIADFDQVVFKNPNNDTKKSPLGVYKIERDQSSQQPKFTIEFPIPKALRKHWLRHKWARSRTCEVA